MSYGKIVAFVSGLAVGAAAAWYYAKKKYERIAQEEIDSVKEVFCGRDEEGPTEDSEVYKATEDAKNKPSIMEYAAKLKDTGYTNYADISKEDEKPESDEGIFVIAPEEFGDFDDYTKLSFTYFSDEVLVDDAFQPINNEENYVGTEALDSFGEYEDDAVHVRNDRLKCYYEILRDQRSYYDYLMDNPHKAEIE